MTLFFRRYIVTVFHLRRSHDEKPSVENGASEMNSNDVLVKIVVTLRRFLDRRNLYGDPKLLLAI